MAKTLIFGHKNPDTDTICSAIAYADLKNKLGVEAEPVRLGDINGETQFALEKFNAELPRFVDEVSKETNEVILVDHNERQQSANDIDQVRVLEVIDHHRIANFETADPLYYRAEPVGCTATILNKMYKENGVEIEPNIAGLMLSAIISDSLLFKSPTCTDQDVAAAKELAEIAGVDASLDAKEFSMGTSKVEIAQVNAIDVNDVLVRKVELEEAITKTIEEKGLQLFLLVVTDILNSNSTALALGSAASKVEEAYNVTLEKNTAVLEGVVSRKKQVVPVLTSVFA
jgi:manganese-dependent inorganic pyrophosphatase